MEPSHLRPASSSPALFAMMSAWLGWPVCPDESVWPEGTEQPGHPGTAGEAGFHRPGTPHPPGLRRPQADAPSHSPGSWWPGPLPSRLRPSPSPGQGRRQQGIPRAASANHWPATGPWRKRGRMATLSHRDRADGLGGCGPAASRCPALVLRNAQRVNPGPPGLPATTASGGELGLTRRAWPSGGHRRLTGTGQ